MRGIGIVFAVEREARATLEDASFEWTPLGPSLWASARHSLRLAVSGVGKAFAVFALSRVAEGANLILSFGTAGSLKGEEAVGSFVLAREAVEYDMDAAALRFPPGVTPYSGMSDPVIRSASDAALGHARAAMAAAGLRFFEGRIASGDAFLNDPVRSRFIREHTGADAVDMESAALAKITRYRLPGVDFLAIRALSDSSNRLSPRTWCADAEGLCVAFPRILRGLLSLREAA